MANINAIMQKVSTLSEGISTAISQQEKSSDEISRVLGAAAQGTSHIAEVLVEVDAIGKQAAKI